MSIYIVHALFSHVANKMSSFVCRFTFMLHICYIPFSMVLTFLAELNSYPTPPPLLKGLMEITFTWMSINMLVFLKTFEMFVDSKVDEACTRYMIMWLVSYIVNLMYGLPFIPTTQPPSPKVYKMAVA